MNRIFLSAPDISGRERALVEAAFDSNYIAPAGAMLTQFENDMCAYTGHAHGVAVASGTAALHLALRILGIGKGDEVWTSSMTFIGGASPITFVGATPVFFDLSPDSWTIDCDLLEDCLEKAAQRGKLPAAIMPTDLYGQSCDLDRLCDMCNRYDVHLVVDSAEALGAFYKARHAGKGATCAVLSFNGNKMITTSGGGMLLSDDPEIIDKARFLSTQARENVIHYEHKEIGYNYRMSNICAAIGVGQLEQIEEKVAKRRAHFDAYEKALADLGVTFMPEPDGYRSTRWLTCLLLPEARAGLRDHVQSACEAAEIEVRPLWKPMHMQPVFKDAPVMGGHVAEGFFAQGLCLPSGSGMGQEDHGRVVETLRTALG